MDNQFKLELEARQYKDEYIEFIDITITQNGIRDSMVRHIMEFKDKALLNLVSQEKLEDLYRLVVGELERREQRRNYESTLYK